MLEAGPSHQKWCIVMHESADGQSSKTKELDECLSLDLPRYHYL